MSKLIAFGWYGGKYSHLNWLLPLLPKTTHYCEPFGGSAAVLINREPAPVETYNDIDGELVNFFQVLRDQKNELIRAIAFTPFSRKEFELSISQPITKLSNLERARRFFIRARQVRTGLAQTASSGRWAHCVLTSRAGMAGAVSRWLGSIDDLSKIVQRLQRVQIENQSAIEVIQRYDSEETLFYCDPPYPHNSRGDSKALIVAAAYQVASQQLGEKYLPLQHHTAADKQTGALGDLEITLINDDRVVTSYEMKMKRVTINDINNAVNKISTRVKETGEKIDNYILITTEVIDQAVKDYAATMYERTGGIEIVVLDCLDFLRHFLHLFHRLRMQFIEAYQKLILAEPDSAVSQPLKEAFLVLRQAAESIEVE
jgi:site-specific DNA-adenine methylase